MAADEEKFILTPEGYAHIKQQLALLEDKEKGEREILTDALSDSVGNDDNADVGVEFDARTRKEWTDEKIAHLHYILDRAEIYEDANPSAIDVGERVTLWSFEDRQEMKFDVISSAEVTSGAVVGPGVMDASDASPMGKALLSRRVGDIVEVDAPDGKMRYAVRKIEPIPAA